MAEISEPTRNFNRFEIKYYLSLKQASLFKTALRKFMLPDEHSVDGCYFLTSLYYDSPDLRCYDEKEFGLVSRRKLRIRTYEPYDHVTEDTTMFVEIKQRVNQITRKRRAVLPYLKSLQLCNNREYIESTPEDQPVIDEIFTFLWQYNLRPSCIIRYKRQAFVGTEYDPGLRVTFDSSITCQPNRLYIHESVSDFPVIPANRVVMEIKVNDRIPNWLTDLIAVHNFQRISISKYSLGMEAAMNLPYIQLMNPVIETAEEVAASAPSIFKPIEPKVEIQGN